MQRKPRRGVTPADLLAALASVGLLAALMLQSLSATREAADAAKCQNNLRQLAIGMRNHHDQRGDLPPMGTFSGGISWAGLLLPYVEQVDFYRRLRLDMPYDAPPNNDVRHLRGPNAAFPFFYCPTRRQAPKYTDGFSVSDFAVPSVGANPKLDDPTLDDTWMQCYAYDKSFGPLLLVREEQPEEWKAGKSLSSALRFRSRTSFAGIVDGVANQVFFGEKAVHPDLQGKAGKAGDFTCYSFIANDFNASGAARPGNGGICPSPQANKATAYRNWGSWHPGYCRFAMGDGSIRKLNNEMSSELLTRLCDRRDGARFKLPPDANTLLDDSMLGEPAN